MPPLSNLVPLPSSAREDGVDRRELSFSRNEVRLYEPIPVIFGKHKVVPPLGAKVITEVVGGQLYQRILVVWGYGPLSVSDIKISGRPIAEYADISSETREGRSSDAALTLYPGSPVTTPVPMAVTAIRVRVTDQLPRNVNEISGVVTSEAQDWNSGAGIWEARATSNPASMMRLALQHPGRRSRSADGDIDLDALADFHAFCVTHGYEFNATHDRRRSIFDMVTDICAAGRARPTVPDGRWSVAIDREASDPVEHFCPLNMDAFEVRRSFARRLDAVRLRFPNRSRDWRRDERIVYRAGVGAGTATELQTVSPLGITDPEHVWKLGRRLLAEQEETEAWTGRIAAESVNVKRGDRVTVSHENIGASIASAWVAAVDTSGGKDRDIELDVPIMFAAGHSYAAKFRTDDDADLQVRLDAGTAGQTLRTIRIVSADRPDAGTIKVGDLVSVGIAGAVRAEATVTEVERRSDLEASVTMAPVRAAVYDAEDGPVPAFASALSTISTPLPPLVVSSISSAADVRRQIGNVVEPRIKIDCTPIPVAGARIDCQLRPDGETDWGPSEIAHEDMSQVVLSNVQAGENYDIRLRWVLPEDDRVGPWNDQSHALAEIRPDPVTGFSVGADPSGSRRYAWRPPSDDDLAGVEIRYGASGTAWAAMTKLHEGLLTASPWWSYEPGAGTYDFEARAVDTDGLHSVGVRVNGRTLGVVRSLGRFKELEAYRKYAVNIQATNPQDTAESGSHDWGSYVFSTKTFTPPTGWSATWPASVGVNEVVWGLFATADDEAGDTWTPGAGDWGGPILLEQDTEIIQAYQRATSSTTPGASAGVPTGWYDDVADVPAGAGLIYITFGRRRRGQTLFTWQKSFKAEGQDGSDGINGTTWHFGDGVPASALGVNGDFYLRGDTEDVYEKASGTWTKRTNIKGAPGEDGATWTSGTGVPNNADGISGDWYFRVGTGAVAGQIYRKVEAAWVKQIDIDQGSEGAVWYSAASNPDASLGNVGNWFLNTDSGDVFEKVAGPPVAWTKRSNIFFIKDASVLEQHLAPDSVSQANKEVLSATLSLTSFGTVEGVGIWTPPNTGLTTLTNAPLGTGGAIVPTIDVLIWAERAIFPGKYAAIRWDALLGSDKPRRELYPDFDDMSVTVTRRDGSEIPTNTNFSWGFYIFIVDSSYEVLDYIGTGIGIATLNHNNPNISGIWGGVTVGSPSAPINSSDYGLGATREKEIIADATAAKIVFCSLVTRDGEHASARIKDSNAGGFGGYDATFSFVRYSNFTIKR